MKNTREQLGAALKRAVLAMPYRPKGDGAHIPRSRDEDAEAWAQAAERFLRAVEREARQ